MLHGIGFASDLTFWRHWISDLQHGVAYFTGNYPPLYVLWLRVVGVIQNDLKIQLRSIDQNGSEDPANWDIGIRLPKQGPEARFFPDPKRSMNRSVKMNGVIRPGTAAEGAYRVTKAGFENRDGEKTPFIELVSAKDATETYKLYPDETVKEKAVQVRFVYLNPPYGRIRNNAQAVLAKYSFIKKIGENLPPLQRAKEKEPKYRELYRLEKANEDGSEVVPRYVTIKIGRRQNTP